MATKESLIAQGLWDHYNDRPAVKPAAALDEAREPAKSYSACVVANWLGKDTLVVSKSDYDALLADNAELKKQNYAMGNRVMEAERKLAEPEWIPVSERLPDNEDVKYQFWRKPGGYAVGSYIDGSWYDDLDVDNDACHNDFPDSEVTHWMQLPAAPKREDKA